MVEVSNARLGKVLVVFKYNGIDLQQVARALDERVEETDSLEANVQIKIGPVADMAGSVRIFENMAVLEVGSSSIDWHDSVQSLPEFFERFQTVIDTTGVGSPDSIEVDILVDLEYESGDIAAVKELLEERDVTYDVEDDEYTYYVFDVNFPPVGYTGRVYCSQKGVQVRFMEVEYSTDGRDIGEFVNEYVVAAERDLNVWLTESESL